MILIKPLDNTLAACSSARASNSANDVDINTYIRTHIHLLLHTQPSCLPLFSRNLERKLNKGLKILYKELVCE